LTFLFKGYSDARGFRQWEQARRRVRKGEKAFHILAPVIRKVVDEAGDAKLIVVGFKGVPVFGLEQTDGWGETTRASSLFEGRWHIVSMTEPPLAGVLSDQVAVPLPV
jgi:hypothetical protein